MQHHIYVGDARLSFADETEERIAQIKTKQRIVLYVLISKLISHFVVLETVVCNRIRAEN